MIRETILQIDPDAKVFLFGSRTDDMAKGGDIDLLILSIIFTTRDLRKLKIHLEDRLGRQKIDLIWNSKAKSRWSRRGEQVARSLLPDLRKMTG